MPLKHFPPPPGIKAPPLSFATRVGELLFISGATSSDLVKVNVLLTRAADVADMNALYASAFGPAPYPARTTCVVQALPDAKMLIEIEGVAALKA
jgi:enamine deaminase RidA (YjgF/YER057c/UK114 family)